jgi:hypothetical protein
MQCKIKKGKTMKELKPSIDEWKILYDTALEFKKLQCWEWMYDSDIFGVKNPANGDIGYCSVMGNLGEFLALAVYSGTEGLDTYIKAREGEIRAGTMESLTSQKCLMVSFEDRDDLTDKDREIIKELGLKFRGHMEWPLFRDYTPGYHPWYLTSDQIQYLTLALQQTMELAIRFNENRDILISPDEESILVRVPKKTKSGLQWKDEWLKPEPFEDKQTLIPKIEESALEEIIANVETNDGIWEIDLFLTPMPIGEKGGERPFYPYMILFVDGNMGVPLNFGITKQHDHAKEFVDKFLNTILQFGIPSEILVKSKKVYEILRLIAEQLDIELTAVNKLEKLEAVQKFLMRQMR